MDERLRTIMVSTGVEWSIDYKEQKMRLVSATTYTRRLAADLELTRYRQERSSISIFLG